MERKWALRLWQSFSFAISPRHLLILKFTESSVITSKWSKRTKYPRLLGDRQSTWQSTRNLLPRFYMFSCCLRFVFCPMLSLVGYILVLGLARRYLWPIGWQCRLYFCLLHWTRVFTFGEWMIFAMGSGNYSTVATKHVNWMAVLWRVGLLKSYKIHTVYYLKIFKHDLLRRSSTCQKVVFNVRWILLSVLRILWSLVWVEYTRCHSI